MSAHQTLQDLDDEDDFKQQLLQKIKSTKICLKLKLIHILKQLGKTFSNKKADIYLCYDYTKLIASKLGLQTHTLNRKELLNCLAYIYRNCHNINSVKTDDSTYLWFCLTNRPARAENALGIYKFKHQLIISLEWETTGSVVILQLMCWWNNKLQDTTTTVLTQVNSEYDMYYYYQQIIGGHNNYRWLRTMYHSIGQQLMHQNPYAKPGDKTGFHHINVNVPDAITTGKSINMIEKSLILTAEEPGNCTEILPEMHNHLENWWELVEEQDLSTDSYIHCIKDTMYTKDNERKFGIRWTDVICKPGDV
ncbi:conserved hypothetical protein [Coccidioides posadasii str. Silveira]|uniref:Uncharacterized protein n=1 Tax=Coccidioides posadasii (strain RMSCC 757 / Silveira) TaxID=443226 RepID=E9DH38_COCPS|nr:conserved hypothetical protein [Coccidioides posadasii str. Silveira]